jgi:hypothetical protein
VVDSANGEVRIAAKLNRVWCDDSVSRHNCCVYEHGVKGPTALFQAHCPPADFYDALIDIGASPGIDIGDSPDSSARISGSKLDISIRWEGSPKTYALSELIQDSLGRGFEPRMHNSRQRAIDTNMGCIFCYVSCKISISSNALYTWGEGLQQVSRFKARGDLLPTNGTELIIIFKLAR